MADIDAAYQEIRDAQTLDELAVVERRWLGRKGIVTVALREHAERERRAREIESVMERINQHCDERLREIS